MLYVSAFLPEPNENPHITLLHFQYGSDISRITTVYLCTLLFLFQHCSYIGAFITLYYTVAKSHKLHNILQNFFIIFKSLFQWLDLPLLFKSGTVTVIPCLCSWYCGLATISAVFSSEFTSCSVRPENVKGIVFVYVSRTLKYCLFFVDSSVTHDACSCYTSTWFC
jgi:hypothetical protein